MTVNLRGSGVVAPNPMMTATSPRAVSADGQPATTRKTDGSASQSAARTAAWRARRWQRKNGVRQARRGGSPDVRAQRSSWTSRSRRNEFDEGPGARRGWPRRDWQGPGLVFAFVVPERQQQAVAHGGLEVDRYLAQNTRGVEDSATIATAELRAAALLTEPPLGFGDQAGHVRWQRGDLAQQRGRRQRRSPGGRIHADDCSSHACARGDAGRRAGL